MRVSFHVGGVTAVAFAATLALLGCGGSLDDEPMAREASAKAEPDVQPSNVASQSLEKTRAPDDVAEIRRELAALRKDVNDMQRRLDRTHAQSTDAARTAQALQPVQSEAERLARNESAFRIESADPTWSRNAELRIRTAVTQIGDGVPDRIRGLECRSKTCRVEIAPDDFQSVDEALPRITAQLGDTFASAESAHFDQGDGRIAGVLFLSR